MIFGPLYAAAKVLLTPTELYQTLMLSSGAMSTRIEKLVQRGFIERIASEDDRRSCKVMLTEPGQQKLDVALQDHLDNMEVMLEALNKDERLQLANLLKKVLLHSR